MTATVEISMYPLNQDYEKPILDFIDRLNTFPDLRIETNSMSTQIRGDYDQIMQVLTVEMKTSFQQDNTVIMVLKIVHLTA